MATIETLKSKRRWYTRQVDKPWETGSAVYIIVRGDTTERDKPQAEYFTEDIMSAAVSQICDFYGKETVSETLASTVDIHFSPRPMAMPLLSVKLEKEIVKQAPKKTDTAADISQLAQTYPLRTFTKRIKALSKMFTALEKQSKIFSGRTTPSVNFIQLYNQLDLAHNRINELIKFNGLNKKRQDDEGSLNLYFDNNFNILDASVTQRGIEKYLTKGTQYFLQDTQGLKNKRVNKLLYDLNQIYSLRNNPPTWSDFIRFFMSDIQIDLSARPKTLTEGERIADRQEENNPMWISQEELARERAELNDRNTQIKMMNEALVANRAEVQKKLNKRLAPLMEGMRDIEDKAEVVRQFINRFGINHLIEAAIECLVIQTGFAPSNMPNMLGLNPYGLRPPPFYLTLPPIPTQLPIVDISKRLTNELMRALEKALVDALYDAIQILADLILSLCHAAEAGQIGDGQPLNSIIDAFPSPTEMNKEGGTQGGFVACQEEYAIDPEASILFLKVLSDNLTPMETCELINGGPSTDVLDSIKNILASESEFTEHVWRDGDATLQEIFSDTDVLISFFLCIGNLISLDYCEQVNQVPPIDIGVLGDLDPCTIEDMLADAIDTADPESFSNLFDDLIDIYNNPENLFGDLVTDPLDMSCGGGIMPSFVDMPAYNHSINRMMNGLFEVPKITFSSEIDGIKSILRKPKPGCSEKNLEHQELLEKLKEVGSYPIPADPDPPVDPDAPSQLFLANIFGTLASQQLFQNDQVAGLQTLVTGIAGAGGVPGCPPTIEYEISPEYKRQLENIDTKMVAPWSPVPPATSLSMWGADYENMYLQLFVDTAFRIDTNGALDGGRVWMTFVPGSAGTEADPINEVKIGGAEAATGPGTATTHQIDLRERMTTNFFNEVYGDYSLANGVGAFATSYEGNRLREGIKSAFYFPGYKSLLNSLAYNVRKSEMFTDEGFSRLTSLLQPRPCPGDPEKQIGGDLFDINTIIQEGLDEFAENSCTDRTCVVGPVEDALIFAVTNAYIQVLLVEQLLKNIFLIDAYGLSDYIIEPALRDKIFKELTESADVLLPALKDASIIYVEKLRLRLAASGEAPTRDDGTLIPVGTALPHPDPDPAGRFLEISATWVGEEAAGNTSEAYRTWAFEYMIQRRLINTIAVFRRVFSESEADFNVSFVLNGLPVVEPLQRPFSTNSDASGVFLEWVPINGLRTLQLKNPTDGDGATLIDYNYGRPRGRTGDPSLSDAETSKAYEVSQDEADVAAANGLFTREKYVKFNFDFDKFFELQSSNDNPAVAFQKQQMYAQLKPLIEEHLGVPLDSSLYDSAGAVPPAGGLNDFVVSIGAFNNFINSIRAADTQRAISVSTVTARYIFNPISPEADQHEDDVEHERRSMYNLSQGPLMAFSGRHIPGENYGTPSWDMRPRAWRNKAGAHGWLWGGHRYREVHGPITRKNYDAIRFYINEVQGGRWWADNTIEARTPGGSLYNWSPEVENSVYGSSRPTFNLPRVHRTWYTTPGYNSTDTLPPENFIDGESRQQQAGLDIYPYRGVTSYSTTAERPIPPRRDKLNEVHNTYYEPGDTFARSNPLSEKYDNFYGRIEVRWDAALHTNGSPDGYIKYRPTFYDLYNYRDPTTGNMQPNWWNAEWWFDLYYDFLPAVHEAGMAYIEAFGEFPPVGFMHNEPGARNTGGGAYVYERNHRHHDTFMERYVWIQIQSGVSESQAGDGVWRINSVDYPGGSSESERDSGTAYYNMRQRPYGNFGSLLSIFSYFFKLNGEFKTMSEIWNNDGMPAGAPIGDFSLANGSTGIDAIWLNNPVFAEMMKDLSWDEYSNLVDAANIAATPAAAGDLTGIPLYDASIDSFIKNIRIGTRISYNSPMINAGAGAGSEYEDILNNLALVVGGSQSFKEQSRLYYNDKSGFLVSSAGPVGAGQGLIWNVNTGIKSEVKIADGLSDFKFTDRTVVGRVEETEGIQPTQYIDYNLYDIMAPFFELHEKAMIDEMVQTSEYRQLFNKAYDVKSLIVMLFIFGLLITESTTPELRHLFSDTKQSLRIILRAALAGKDYAYEDVEGTTAAELAQNAALELGAATAGTFAAMGFSFVLKMLIETPKGILMALAEMIDPHVSTGKLVKDVSAVGIQMAEAAYMAAQAAGAPAIPLPGCEPGTNEPNEAQSLVEMIQTGIDIALAPVPPFLRPEVSMLGLDLIGSLPWIFAIRPGPLGVAYILLSLGPDDVDEFFAGLSLPFGSGPICEEDQQDCLPAPARPALPAPAVPAEEDEEPDTDDC